VRGRKPTPTHLRLLKGNPARRPLPEGEPQPDAVVPEKPDWLNAAAAEEWDRIVPQLLALGLLTDLDRAVLVKYCQAWAAVVELEREIEENGWWVPTGEGGRRRNPAAASLREAWERLQSAASEFGMTPVSRSRLGTTGRAESDPLEGLARRRKRR